MSAENSIKYPVIFIHGLMGNLKDWDKTVSEVSKGKYFDMVFHEKNKIYHNFFGEKVTNWYWNVSYYTTNILEESINGNLTLYALRFKKIIDHIKKLTGKDKVIIIAHSMGGLISKKYMTLSPETWENVYKLLTVATPNLGFGISVNIIKQLRDLKRNSKFIEKLDASWEKFINNDETKKWGVIGCINKKIFNNITDDPLATDTGGIGYVEISSSIPKGEWIESIGVNMDKEFFNTKNFGFRLATIATHTEILYHPATFKGINWAITT